MENGALDLNTRPKIRHQHNLYMNDSTLIKPEFLVHRNEVLMLAEMKKAMSAQQLAKLPWIDPKCSRGFGQINNLLQVQKKGKCATSKCLGGECKPCK